MITTLDLSAASREQVMERRGRQDLGRWLAQVQQVRQCSHPVRLRGSSDTVDTTTGEILASYDSAGEPDGVTYVRCGNRRAAVCPSCSQEYQGDVWHLIMAGAAGGMKDVPATIVEHPLVFATLTAPSFGVVHAARRVAPGRPIPGVAVGVRPAGRSQARSPVGPVVAAADPAPDPAGRSAPTDAPPGA